MKPDWRETFDKLFHEVTLYKAGSPAGLKVEAFIEDVLVDAHEEILEMIKTQMEIERNAPPDDKLDGWHALFRLLNTLEPEEPVNESNEPRGAFNRTDDFLYGA